MTMRSPERVQYMTAGLTKSVLLASSAPARPHIVPRYDEADQPVARGGKPDRLHARFVGAQALNHQAEARIDDTPDQIEPAEQAGEAEIIELHAVRQVDEAAEIAALVDGQAVVAAVAGEPGGDVIGHLRKCQRDHDEVDAAGAQGERADHQREQRRGQQRHRPLNEAGADAFGGENADRIAADPEIGGVTEAHHAAIAHDEVEACRGEREDDDAGEQRQREDVAAQRGIERKQPTRPATTSAATSVAGVERSLHRRLAGNSPSGRTTSTIAITR